MIMEEIIKPIPEEDIISELQKVTYIKTTSFGHNDIFEFDYHQSPLLMKEVARLREITFRASGGGTGKSADIDFFDTCKEPFRQLIIWNQETKEIIGGYRYKLGRDMKSQGHEIYSPTGELFYFSDDFIENYKPYTVELGRSFVIPEYQASNVDRKGIAALFDLWDGIGSVTTTHSFVKYFFGKFTMYRNYNIFSRDVLLRFANRYFPDNECLCWPKQPIMKQYPAEMIDKYFMYDDYHKERKKLTAILKKQGETIPPLINSYMNISSTMKFFGTSLNPGFGNVEESGILITVADMDQRIVSRFGRNNNI